jgi:hypothetical protein
MLACAGAGWAQTIEPLPGKNLALGKPVTFSLEPNYNLTKGGDETDLTDGKYWQPASKTSFWGEQSTVGWSWGGSGAQPGVLITLDLGAVSAIAAVSFDSASGASQVTFPGAVLLYVSDDGESWRHVTDLINEAVPQDKYIRHRFVAKDLRTRGRYVGVYVVKGGFYAFVDEIEVMAGDHDPAGVTFTGAAVAKAGLEAHVAARAKTSVQKNTSLYFIQTARDLKPDAATVAALDRLQAEAVTVAEVEAVDFSRGLPYTKLDREVCRAMGICYQGRTKSPMTLWAPEPTMWSNTSPFARPAEERPPRLHADMMSGEREPVAFNVSNSGSG